MSFVTLRVGLSALSLSLAAVLSTPVLAVEPEGEMGGKPAAAAASEPQRDASAMKALEGMAEFYKGLKHYSVKASGDLGEAPMGKGRMTVSATLAVAKPNRLRAVAEGGKEGADNPMGAGGTVVSDGKKVLYAGSMMGEKKHVETDAPGELSEITQDMNYMFSLGAGASVTMIPFMLASEDGLTQITDDAHSIKDGGVSMMDGVEVRTIVITVGDEGEEGEGKLFIQTGEKPWFRGMAFKAKAGEGEPAQSMEMKYTDWTDAEPASETFTLKAPEGSKAVSSFIEGLGGDHADEAEAPHDSIGKAAPALNLPVIGSDSAKIDLASYKGKNIVVVDFWATWCGPCVKALPHVTKVTSELKEQGVVFLAVNVGEEPEKVKAFMDKKGWTFTALSDQDNAVSESFGVSGIPHTAIIDKDGKVRQVHVGFAPGNEKKLKAELEALIAGKDPLAGEKKDADHADDKGDHADDKDDDKDDDMGGYK